MNRKEFFKKLGLGAIAIASAPSILAKEGDSNETLIVSDVTQSPFFNYLEQKPAHKIYCIATSDIEYEGKENKFSGGGVYDGDLLISGDHNAYVVKHTDWLHTQILEIGEREGAREETFSFFQKIGSAFSEGGL